MTKTRHRIHFCANESDIALIDKVKDGLRNSHGLRYANRADTIRFCLFIGTAFLIKQHPSVASPTPSPLT